MELSISKYNSKALQSLLSDHCPVQCTITTKFPIPNTFCFENYWLKMPDFKKVITNTWSSLGLAHSPFQLNVKLQTLRKEIRKWSKTKIRDINVQAAACNMSLLWITQAEEVRSVTELEKLMRRILTERLLKIDKIKELKWRQRAKRQWIKEGDRNTSYFHAVATQQKRVNTVTSMSSQGAQVTEHSKKANLFFQHFCSLMGAQADTAVNFNLQTIYAGQGISQAEADSLMQPWTEADIAKAVTTWKGNKSPGPDGFTGEFYNTFLDVLMPNLKEVFAQINRHPHSTLQPLNDSYIVLVPKKEVPLTPLDFRPISLVNGIQRIYSKIMATKLKPLLEKMLSPNQTGFLKKRSILHAFHYAQQVVQSATKQNQQLAIFKADIYKAFDTLNWQFLLDSLKARGIPQPWIECVHSKVLMGSSRVILNSVAGKPIQLKKRVRQGDPLSPYLFNLSIDLLPQWMQILNNLNFLTPPFPHCKSPLLYADDTLLFLKPSTDQISRVKLLFVIFEHTSGLKINLSKSELVVTCAPLSLVQNLADIIQCKPLPFPINYLGLPLSDRNLTRADYLPLLDRIQSSLAGWTTPLLSIGGRLILTNSVMTAIPQYFMSIFLLPKWVLCKIDQIRKKFFWHGHKEQQSQDKALYMVNWALAT